MGKNLRQQARGKGGTTYRAHSFRWVAAVKHRVYDDTEKTAIMQGKVIDLVDCSGHTAPLAKVQYDNKEIGYIFAPMGISVNDIIASGEQAQVKVGNTLPLKNIPEGTAIFNIEKIVGDRGKFVHTSGTSAKIITVTKNSVTVMLPSHQEKTFDPRCRATIGVIAGGGRSEKPFVKAGTRHHAMRARGKLYPRTSGVAMNAVDHPFGSGRGRHVGKPKTVSRFAPPGRKVGMVAAKRTGVKR